MSDNASRPRTRCANANTHPGKIINDLKQKRRTTSKKAADDQAKASKEKKEAAVAKKNRRAIVAQVAEVEDALRREDKAYPNIINEGDSDSDTHRFRGSHSDGESEVDHSEAKEPEDTASNQVQSESNLDSDVHMSEPEGPEGRKVVVRDSDDDDSDDEYESDSDSIDEGPDTDEDESEHSDSRLEELEDEIVARRKKKTGKKKPKGGSVDKGKKKTKAPTPAANHSLREEVTRARKTSAVSGHKRKPEEPIEDSSDEREDEEDQRTKRPQKKIKKRKGETATASGLRKDWRKLLNDSGSSSKYKKSATMFNPSLKDPTLIPTQPRRAPTIVDADDDCVTVASELSQSRPSSRTSAWSRTRSTSEGLDSARDLWPSGIFDDDEIPSSLQAAHTAKKAKHTPLHPTGSQPSANYNSNRTTSAVGLVVKKKDVNTSAGPMRGPIIKSEGNELSKPYRNLKVSDIPIAGEHELAQWDLIVRRVLDWAGTLLDTFGTNEHPDLLVTIQGLWDKCLPERTEDVHTNPAIKKVVIDRLNEWRSTIGKKAVTILSDFIKHDATLRRDSGEVATFVRGLLPRPHEQPIIFPLIYADPEASKAKAPTNFGYPTGALALSTAALEHGLTLFKTGVNIQDEKATNNTSRAFDNNPWGGVACQYSQSTSDLRERKWVQIMRAASVYLADRVGNSNMETQRSSVIPDGRSKIVVSDDGTDEEADIQGVGRGVAREWKGGTIGRERVTVTARPHIVSVCILFDPGQTTERTCKICIHICIYIWIQLGCVSCQLAGLAQSGSFCIQT
ncbi:hypothetical protein H4582DRAFT_2055430 [Lactarius indigo]|nr:hypothetical protein H4582DRAFT_2055430 [Lactarius indigo]